VTLLSRKITVVRGGEFDLLHFFLDEIILE
jgi:hypothetical protein